MDEGNQQIDWNVKQDIAKMISKYMSQADDYAIGNYSVPVDRIAMPDYIRQTKCWERIEEKIYTRLNPEQKKELTKIRKWLKLKTWKRNPDYFRLKHRPKMRVCNDAMGKYNKVYIRYVWDLISNLGLGFGEKDSWEGDF